MPRTDSRPEATGDDTATVAVGARDFRRRRRGARLRRLRPLLVAFLVVAILAGGAWLVLFSSVLTLRDVRVVGNSSVSGVRVERVARAPMGEQLARVDVDAIAARVETIPAVESARVSRSWPRTLRIEVTERTPVAVVDRGTGLQAVDDDGVLFGSYDKRPASLPLVRTRPGVGTDALAEAAHVVASLRSDIRARVAYVDVETVDRIQLRLQGGRVVLWGSAEKSADKAAVLAVLLRQKGTTQIDVSVPGRPTTK